MRSRARSDDPHYTSGVGNHLFYLLAEGSGTKTIGGKAYNSTTCNSTTVAGIGRDKAAADLVPRAHHVLDQLHHLPRGGRRHGPRGS